MVFTLAFGINMQSLIFNRNDHSVISVLNLSYWAFFGEISLLEALKENEDLYMPTKYYANAALVIYMLIASILLINIVISMFK